MGSMVTDSFFMSCGIFYCILTDLTVDSCSVLGPQYVNVLKVELLVESRAGTQTPDHLLSGLVLPPEPGPSLGDGLEPLAGEPAPNPPQPPGLVPGVALPLPNQPVCWGLMMAWPSWHSVIGPVSRYCRGGQQPALCAFTWHDWQ